MTPKTAETQSKERIASTILMNPTLALRIFAPRPSAGPQVLGSPFRCVSLNRLSSSHWSRRGRWGARGTSLQLHNQWPCSCFHLSGWHANGLLNYWYSFPKRVNQTVQNGWEGSGPSQMRLTPSILWTGSWWLPPSQAQRIDVAAEIGSQAPKGKHTTEPHDSPFYRRRRLLSK